MQLPDKLKNKGLFFLFSYFTFNKNTNKKPILKRFLACVAGVLVITGQTAFAKQLSLFGPETFIRDTGKPVNVINTFSNPYLVESCLIKVYNRGINNNYQAVSSAVITLNGAQVFAPNAFKPKTTYLEKAVDVLKENTLEVEDRSKPGSALTVIIECTSADTTPPTIITDVTPPANEHQWHNTDASVGFICSDQDSGIAFCSAPVVVSNEGSKQVIEGLARDVNTNEATASVTINLDKTLPDIQASPTPQTNAEGWHNTNVTIHYTCNDKLSGIQTCPSPLVENREGEALATSAVAIDKAGNLREITTTLNIDKTPPQITIHSPADGLTLREANISVSGVVSDTHLASATLNGMNLSLAADSSFSQPLTLVEGLNQIQINATDIAGNASSQSISINYQPNRPPEITSTPVTTATEGAPYSYAVTASDPDGDQVILSLVTAPPGMTLDANGVINWLPDFKQAGEYEILISAADEEFTVEQTFMLTVANTNRAPEITSTPGTEGLVNEVYNYQVTATDPDEEALSIELVSAPVGMTISPTGLISWTPLLNQVGAHVVVVEVNDGAAAVQQSFSIIILNPNHAPIITYTEPSIGSPFAGTYFLYQVQAEDPDGDILSYSLLNAPEGMAIDNETGNISWIPPLVEQATNYSITVVVSDGAIQVSQDYEITVTPLPSEASIEGNDFWFNFLDYAPKYRLFISAKSASQVSIKRLRNNQVIQVAIDAMGSKTIELPYESGLSMSNGVEKNGIHITATTPITVYAASVSRFVGEAFSVFPTHMLGKEHRVMSYPINGSNFGLMATEDNTQVEIIPSDTIFKNSKIFFSDPINLTLNKGETFKIQGSSEYGVDYTGSTIQSNKPVAVFAGHSCVTIPVFYGYCDQLIEQLLPLNLWDKRYIISPFFSRLGGDTVKVLANEDQTDVRINGRLVSTLQAGEFYQTFIEQGSVIESENPILVGQFSNGDQFDYAKRKANSIEEEFGFFSRIDQRENLGEVKSHQVTVQDVPGGNSVLIAAYKGETVFLDGEAVSEGFFVPQKDSAYKLTQLAISPGEHTVSSTAPLLVIANGNTPLEVYADPALALVPSEKLFSKHYFFSVPEKTFARNFINLVMPDDTNGLLLDGWLVPDSFREPIANSAYVQYRLAVNPGHHVVSALKPFGLSVYGFNRHESYAYFGGGKGAVPGTPISLKLTVKQNMPYVGESVCMALDVGVIEFDSFKDIPLTLASTGAHNWSELLMTDENGQAEFCFMGYRPGEDIITANVKELEQSITLQWQANINADADPVIETWPLLYGFAGRTYSSSIHGIDPAGGDLSYALKGDIPEGLLINAQTGALSWDAPVRGRYKLAIELTNSRNRSVSVDLDLDILPAIKFNSTPGEIAFLNNTWRELLTVDMPGIGLVLYEFEDFPAGMTGVYTRNRNGLQRFKMQWTPTTVGVFPVKIKISDIQGRYFYYDFNLTVRPPNQAPVFLSDNYQFSGKVTEPLIADIDAEDPEGDEFTFSISNAPFGMNIDALTGVINWTPRLGDFGTKTATVKVRDEYGAQRSTQVTFNIEPNLPPVFESTPTGLAFVGLPYQYQVNASDPEGSEITYGLVSAPNGAILNASTGQLTWTPDTTGLVEFTVGASDGLQTITQTWGFAVYSADQGLQLSIAVDKTFINEGENILLSSNLSGLFSNDISYALTVDGIEHAISTDGSSNITLSGIGEHLLKVTATDLQTGIISEDSISVYIRDPNDTSAPNVTIHNLQSNDRISAPREIIATISDDNLQSWFVAIKTANEASSEFQVLAEGSQALTQAPVGVIDTSMMVNGQYILLVQAQDASGQQTSQAINLIVDGELKVGNFSFTVEDLNVPVAGIPIRVTRTYDSRRKAEDLDFGYGWSVGYQDIKIEESRDLGIGWALNEYPTELVLVNYCIEPLGSPLVTVTLPDGDVETFEVSASPRCNLGSPILDVSLAFTASGDTQSTLATKENATLRLVDGHLEILAAGVPYDTDQYILTTRAGYEYHLDQNFGIEKVIDPNGHTLTYSDNGIVHSSGKRIDFVRDNQGRIASVIDPMGQSIHYQYNAKGDLNLVRERDGAETTYTYNDRHGLLDIIDPLGRNIIKNIYDNDGRLIAQEDSEGNRTDFNHDLAGRQSVVTDRLGNTTVYYYDERGNVTSQVDALGHISHFSYDERGNQLSQTDPLGYTRTATFNTSNDQLSQTDPLGNTATFSYNTRGQETTLTDALGNAFENSYDSVGNLLTITDPEGNTAGNHIDINGYVTKTSDVLGNETSFTYDENGNKLTETDAEGNATTYTYDVNGNVLSETRQQTIDGLISNQTTRYEYDARDRVISTTDAQGNTTRTAYDLAGNEIAQIDALGRRSEMTYDAYGRLTQTHYPDGSTEHKTYDTEGNLIAQIDRLGRTTTMTYDALNRLVRTTYADNTFTTTEYDAANRMVAEIDANGNRTQYEYDAAGRRTAVIDALGHRHNFEYDANGNLIKEIDANGHTTEYVYNTLDQKVATLFHDASTLGDKLDALGRKTAMTDQAGVITRYEYDRLGRLSKVIDALNGETSYTYDEAGNKLTQTDANGRTTRWEYDALGRVTARILPLGQRESFEYDAVGNPISQVDFNGQVTTSQYDTLNRLTSRFYDDGTGISESWVYDAQGRNTQASQTIHGVTHTTTYQYDNRDRLTQEHKPNGDVLAYGYDANGNRTTLTTTLANGDTHTVTYTYDVLNRLETVTDNALPQGTGTTTYTYDAVGNRASVTQANGVATHYTYDSLNRLTQLNNEDQTNTLLQQFDYTLDATGRRTQIDELSGRTSSYTYDDLYRLTSETITDIANGNHSASYTYDKVGNRTQSIINGVTTQYQYDANDRLTQQGGVTYSYDANGNTLTETEDGSTVTYTYDARNRMVSAQNQSGITEYGYDVNGIRESQTSNGSTTRYLIDHNQTYAQVLAETENNVTAKQYTYGDDLLSQSNNGQQHFFLYDGLGTTRALTDTTGLVSDEYFYEAFGELLAQTGNTDNTYLFTGEQYDQNLGQYYLRARYYDPSSARFTQMDTWMGKEYTPITLNKYLYANADPAIGTDPSGYMTLTGAMGSVNIMGTLSTIGYHTAGVSLVGSLLVLNGDSSRVDSQVTPADIAVARVKARSCVQNGNDDCELGIPTIIFGADMWDATNHYWEAQTMMGLPPVLNRGTGFNRGWYTRLSVPECLGRGSSQQCDEYPFNSTTQGGPANYAAGRVSLKLVNGIHNGAAGTLLNSMFSACGVTAGSETDSAFAAIPVPGGESGFYCPGQ